MTSVGQRCRECGRARPSVTYQTDTGTLARALGFGFLAAVVIGVAWGFGGSLGLSRGSRYDWSFWFALLLGFGVAETVSWAANRKRGPNLQVLAIGCVLLGVVVSRVALNLRAARPIGLDAFLSQPLTAASRLGVTLPVLLFVGLACAIAYVRFR